MSRATQSAGFRLLAHPADIGLEFWAPSQAQALVQAAMGLRYLLVDDAPIHPTTTVALQASGQDRLELLYSWLESVLVAFDADGLVPDIITIDSQGDTAIEATVRAEPYDPQCHDTPYYVKAITYHQMILEPREGGWYGRVYVDI